MERNLSLYPWYQGFRNSLFWLPVFFLYFSSLFDLAQVLQLEAIYYLAVVLLEVPSGYFSDRIGRKPTLLIAISCWSAAGFVFAGTSSFGWFVVAQVLLAAGKAFNSGTDTALLFDTLSATGREAEIGVREGRAESVGYFVAGLSGLVGGLLSGFDLRIAYLLFGLGTFGGVVVALRFREPPHVSETPEAALAPHRQLVACLARLRDPVLRWTFVFLVGMTIFNHVPYEFFQPYLDFLFGGTADAGYDLTPALAGALLAVTYVVSSWFSARAMRIQERFGIAGSLLTSLAVLSVIILVMGVWLHPVVVVLLVFRTAPKAVMNPVTRAAMHPRLERRIRATYLSLISLAGRLSFSISLWVASLAAHGTGHVTPPVMSNILFGYAGLAGVVFLVLLAMAPSLARAARAPGVSS